MSRFHLAMASVTLLALGFAVSLEAYRFPGFSLNYFQAAGSLMFWTGGFVLVLALMEGDARRALGFARTRVGTLVGAAYISFHLLLYGYVLEAILVQLYGSPPLVSSAFVFVSSNLLYPASFENALVGLAFNPTLTVLVPPIFDASLSLFSIFAAVVIDLLILANVAAVRQIGSAGGTAVRARAYVAMPLTGIFLGASCCMSLPVLLSIADPALTALSSLLWVFYLAYFVLPLLAAVVLKFNLDLANRTARAASRLAAPP